MDKRIIWFALIVILAVASIIFFRNGCRKPVDIKERTLLFSIDKPTIVVKDSIYYEDNSEGATSWFWDFGDGISSKEQKGYHKYYETGDFTIKLTVNGGVTDSSKYVIVTDGPPPIDGGRVMISGPGKVKVGETATYTDNTPGAQHTNWYNMSSAETKKDSKTYAVTFTHEGEFIITATNELSKGEGSITVKVVPRIIPIPGEKCALCGKGHLTKDHPIPPPPPPGEKCAICKSKEHGTKDHPIPPTPGKQGTSNEQFREMFNAIIAHKDERLSIYTRPIKAAVDNNFEIPVTVNYKGKPAESTTLSNFCSNIIYKNNPKITGVNAVWDAINGYTKFTITVEEK